MIVSIPVHRHGFKILTITSNNPIYSKKPTEKSVG
jgi:hypothetical protein